METERRSEWHIGQRVHRKNSENLGTIVEQDGSIKVKWDDGHTSYYRHGQEANVELEEARPSG
jgi:hypothetical protein